MCYYVLQETECGTPHCDGFYLAIVYRAFCNEPQETKDFELCRGGNAYWFWIQGSYAHDGSLPKQCCRSCSPLFHSELARSIINIKTTPKFLLPEEFYEDEEEDPEWITVPRVIRPRNDLNLFARCKLSYERACSDGVPAMSWIWRDEIDQADVDSEVQRIHESVDRGHHLEIEQELDDFSASVIGDDNDEIDKLDAAFKPSHVARDDGRASEQVDEEMVFLLADSPAVQ